MHNNLKPKLLTYLGALPFIFALLVACYGYFNLSEVFGYELRFARFKSYMLAHTYGAVIVAFLAGIQWGISLNRLDNRQYFITSNVLALLAWVSLFVFASFNGVLIIALAFTLALVIDRHAHKNAVIPEWFWLLRIRISIIVVLSLVLLLVING